MKPAEDYTYTIIPNPMPIQDYQCVCCGYDPCDVYENNFIVAYDPSQAIERKGQYCAPCAWESSLWFKRTGRRP